eukprot:TRINITY_DN53267_c0_g1_i2.p2 TRINITY_DN53267_c0_g1~~TRINITY_DN53267_c0_g1_i2.p2  ORF type:complete len:160 (-),score=45.93 TRINITY_DN53267_c0_g1_i2:161-640(-)
MPTATNTASGGGSARRSEGQRQRGKGKLHRETINNMHTTLEIAFANTKRQLRAVLEYMYEALSESNPAFCVQLKTIIDRRNTSQSEVKRMLKESKKRIYIQDFTNWVAAKHIKTTKRPAICKARMLPYGELCRQIRERGRFPLAQAKKSPALKVLLVHL